MKTWLNSMDIGLFQFLLPELGWGFSRVAAEETGKIGGFFEAEFLGDFLDRKVGGRKQHLDFKDELAVDKLFGRHFDSSISDFIQVVGRDAELVGIKFHLVFFAAVFHQKVAELNEKTPGRVDVFLHGVRSVYQFYFHGHEKTL